MNRQRRKRLADVREKADALHAALETLADQAVAIRDEEHDAWEALPESIREGAKGQSVEEGVSLLDEVVGRIEAARDAAEEIGEAIEAFTESH